LGALLLLIGAVCCVGYRVSSGAEHAVYSPNAVPPTSVHVTANHTYALSYPGGAGALDAQGLSAQDLQCEWSQPGGTRMTLPVVGEDSSASRNAVATFQATVTGSIHVACDGLGAMWIDDADSAGTGWSAWFVLFAILTLVPGVGLSLSALRRGPRAVDSDRPYGRDDEVERLVRMVHLRAEDDEVVDGDGGDVPR
jgi:hypothetical protein